MSFIDELISEYRSRGVLVDSNIMLLWLVGRFDRDQIQRFKRTRKYTVEDFEVVAKLVSFFDAIVTTPHILTEVANLARQLPEDHHQRYFAEMAATVADSGERYATSRDLSAMVGFARFGLTDMAIAEAAPARFLVLTDDFPLANMLGSSGIDVLNFNHVRSIRWGLA